MSTEQYQRNINRYAKAFSQAVQREHPLTTKSINDLKRLQIELNIRDEHIAAIEERILRDWRDIEKTKSFVDNIGCTMGVLFIVAAICSALVPVVGGFLWFVWIILFFVASFSAGSRDSKLRRFNS